MGLNAYFASVVISGNLDFQNALGAVFLSCVCGTAVHTAPDVP